MTTIVRIPWARANLKNISSLVRISCPTLEVGSDLIVELDPRFFEGRQTLQILQYRSHELVSSLARLMDVTLAEENGSNGGDDSGGPSWEKLLQALLEAIRIERYAYKMGRLRHKEPNLFHGRIERIHALLTEAGKGNSLSSDQRFQQLSGAVRQVHVILRAA